MRTAPQATRFARWLSVLTCLVAIGAAPAASHAASDGGAKQIVIAQSTADNPFAARSGLQVGFVSSDTVGSENIAVATSTDCTGCRANAVALQAVVVTTDAHTIVPANVATAANGNCTGCVSYAYAYQYVLTARERVRFSQAGQAQLSALRSEARATAATDLPPDEMTLELDEIALRFKAVVDTELVSSGQTPNGAVSRRVDGY